MWRNMEAASVRQQPLMANEASASVAMASNLIAMAFTLRAITKEMTNIIAGSHSRAAVFQLLTKKSKTPSVQFLNVQVVFHSQCQSIMVLASL